MFYENSNFYLLINDNNTFYLDRQLAKSNIPAGNFIKQKLRQKYLKIWTLLVS